MKAVLLANTLASASLAAVAAADDDNDTTIALLRRTHAVLSTCVPVTTAGATTAAAGAPRLEALRTELARHIHHHMVRRDFAARMHEAFDTDVAFVFSTVQEFFAVQDSWLPGPARRSVCLWGGASPPHPRTIMPAAAAAQPPLLHGGSGSGSGSEEESSDSESGSEEDSDSDIEQDRRDASENENENEHRALPPFLPLDGSVALRPELDTTLFVVPASDATAALFGPALRDALNAFDARHATHRRFRKQALVWNKVCVPGIEQYEFSNLENHNLASPLSPVSEFIRPPSEVYVPLCRLLFGTDVDGRPQRPPPLLHWSLFRVNEGKLFGLNFDSPPGPATARLQYHPYTRDFNKFADAQYAVVLMLSNFDRIIKFYREPPKDKKGKKVTNTQNFKLHNGEVLVIPQAQRACVTASQITKFESEQRQYVFFVFYYGPRVRGVSPL